MSTSSANDYYPSRRGAAQGIQPRVDPVVWSRGAESPIDAGLVASYERDGFLILRNLFSTDDVAAFQRELQQLRDDPLLLIPGSHRHYVTCGGVTPANHYRRSLRKQELGVPDDDSLARLAEAGIVSPPSPAGTRSRRSAALR
jgi:hypothetical protein